MKLFALVAFALVACTPSPVVPPPEGGDGAAPDAPPDMPDASPPVDAGSGAIAACAAMKSAGCAEGSDPNCASTLQHAIDARISQKLDATSTSCIAKATSKAAVRACGGVVCK